MSGRRRRWLWALGGLIGVVLVGVVAWHVHDYGRGSRIVWSSVAWSNLEPFEAQLRRDLPRGTSQQDVENYFAREGIPFGYDFPRYPSYRKPIVIKKELPGDWTNWFTGGMQLYVVFDGDGAVAELEFHQQRI